MCQDLFEPWGCAQVVWTLVARFSSNSVRYAGATLPRAYRGCEQDGEAIQAAKHQCSYGSAIVEYADRFYAVTGKQINEVPSLIDSEQFKQALSACQA
jgi:hypothetical protein